MALQKNIVRYNPYKLYITEAYIIVKINKKVVGTQW